MNNSIQWVFERALARSCRPCYHDEIPSAVTLQKWMGQAADMGIKSVICLLSDYELKEFYGKRGIDLLACYRKHGFSVSHVPVPDYNDPPLRSVDFLRIRLALAELPKPYLIHCSAGIDRTGAAVQFIRSRPDLVRRRR